MKAKFFLIAVAVCHASYAEEFFNPNFLDSRAGKVADLAIYEHGGLIPGIYRLDIYLNGEFLTEDDVSFNKVNVGGKGETRPCVRMGVLTSVIKKTKLAEMRKSDSCAYLNDIDAYAKAEYDNEKQRLYISIPSIFLNGAARGTVPESEWDRGINAFIMNYRFTGVNTKDSNVGNKADDYFLNLTSGLNLEGWRIRNNSTWDYSGEQKEKSQWKNISTYAETSLPSIKSNFSLGQLYTQSHLFENILIKGVQLSSDEEMYPDSLRGFAPTVRGVASTNAKVDITQNGNLIYSTTVSAGPFEINDLYPTTSSGDLFVKITEQNGKIVSYTVPYSTVPNLQREGKNIFAISLGRSDNGPYSKERDLFQASYGLGLSGAYTVNSGVQLAEKYQGYAFGIANNLGDLGAVSSDILFSHAVLGDGSIHNGQSYKLLYAKSLNELGTNIQIVGYRYSTDGYYSFNEAAYDKVSFHSNDDYFDNEYYIDLRKRKKGKAQFSINQRIDGYGNLYLSGQKETFWNSTRSDSMLQLGLNGFLEYLTYNIGFSYSKYSYYDKADKLFSVNLSLPLGLIFSRGMGGDYAGKYNSLYATSTTTLDGNGKASQQTGINGTLLKDNNLSYSLQQTTNGNVSDTMSMSSTYRGENAEFSIGYNYSNSYKQLNYMANGSIVAFNDGVVFGQPIYGSAILVSAPGVAGIPVENTTGVKTDRFGHAVVPYASNYRKNRVALDLTELNEDADINEAVRYVVPTKDAIVRADFESRIGSKAYFTLKEKDGNAIPFGAMVLADNANTGIVDEDGKVFLSGLKKNGTLLVKWGPKQEQQCNADYVLNDLDGRKINKLVLLCH